MRGGVREEGFFGDSRLQWEGHNILDIVFGDMFIQMFIYFEEVYVIGEDGEFCWEEEVLCWL